MPERYSVIGPPGCGKTTYLKRQVERAAAFFGSNAVMVCSLTRAAAGEIQGRNLPIPDDNVGTLHKFAHRAIGRPVVAESKIPEWNEKTGRTLTPSVKSSSPEEDLSHDGGCPSSPSDKIYEQMNIYRHGMVPRRTWPGHVLDFATAWDRWKANAGYTDFTGMIEDALEDVEDAPCNPVAMFVDEAQDMSRLEVALIEKWSSGCATTVLVGDPAQALYTWRGANPDAFMGTGHRKVLSQSYRVPRAAHAAAREWGRALLKDVEYEPTAAEGSAHRHGASMRDGSSVAQIAESHLDDPGSGRLMILAQCGYMLKSTIGALRERGIPFHNPNRVRDGSWNPLAKRKGTSTAERLAAFLTDAQTRQTVSMWLPLLTSSGILRRGAKSEDLPEDANDLLRLFASEDVALKAFSGDAKWLCENAVTKYANSLRYLTAVVRRSGAAGLSGVPRVLVGTIHSFKGAEAEHVVLSPDISCVAYEDYTLHPHDEGLSTKRTFYVGLTRTLDKLTVLSPSNKMHVELPV